MDRNCVYFCLTYKNTAWRGKGQGTAMAISRGQAELREATEKKEFHFVPGLPLSLSLYLSISLFITSNNNLARAVNHTYSIPAPASALNY
jgi:hypothetical protein